MKKGISIWSFPEGTLQSSFRLAKDAGFDGVEVALDETAGEITMTSTEKDLLAIKQQAKDEGIELYSVASCLLWKYWLNSTDPVEQEKAKDVVKKQLDAAAILGCESILVIPGTVNAEYEAPGRVEHYAVAYDRSLEAIMDLKDYAEKCKVEIALENVGNKFLLSPLEMRDFVDKFNSPYVGAYLDVGNVRETGYPEQWVDILNKRIKKIHFKDYRVEVGEKGYVDLLAGDVDYPAVMDALNRAGYDGWVTAEMIPAYKYYPETIIYNTSRAMDAILGRN